MHVRLVCGRYQPERDGVAAYVERLAAALPAAGERAGLDLQADVVEWPGLRRFRPGPADLVHVQYAPAAYGYRPWVGLLPAATRTPVVTTLHEYDWWQWPARVPAAAWRPVERAGWWDRETMLLSARSAALVCTNAAHAAALTRRTGRRAEVVPIGANVDVAWTGGRALARRELGLDPDAPVLVFFGFVHPVKGLRYAIEALAVLRLRHPGTRLLVVGGWCSLAWPDEEADGFVDSLRSLARRHGVEDAVSFLGYQAAVEVSRALAAADLAVLPFTAGLSGKSGSLIACLAHGLPVIGPQPVDGPDSQVTAATAVVERRDAADLERVVDGLLRDAAERDRLVRAGSMLLAGRDWSAVADRHIDLYARALR